MKKHCNAKLFFLTLFSLCLLTAQEATAQTITQNTPLSFGQVVLVDNAAPRQIVLLPGGGFTADPQYVFFTPPQLGNFTVSGYGPGVPLTVTVGITNLNPIGGGTANFSTSSTFTNPATVTTDGAGEVTFDVGATLSSDGGGSTHMDDLYNGTYTITVTP